MVWYLGYFIAVPMWQQYSGPQRINVVVKTFCIKASFIVEEKDVVWHFQFSY